MTNSSLLRKLLFVCVGIIWSARAGIVTQLKESHIKELSIKKVYEKASGGTLPALDTLPWCIIESTSDIIYTFCDGVDYSIMFDARSFLLDKQSKVSEVEKIEEDKS